MKELDLYPNIKKWLSKTLEQRFKKDYEIIVEDTHDIYLSDFLEYKKLTKYFPESSAYKIKTDITGIIKQSQKCELVFVECKVKPIKLLDVGQLLGYSLVAHPISSYLLSPSGISESLENLLNIYGRRDILYYDKNLFIQIGKWSLERNEPRWDQMISEKHGIL